MGKSNLVKRKNTAFKVLLAVFIVIGLSVSFVAGYFTRYLSQGSNANRISWLIDTIDKTYCVYDEDTHEIRLFSVEDYANIIVKGMLDSYSEFYTAEEYSDVYLFHLQKGS